MAKETKKTKSETVVISPPNFQVAVFKIVGTSPYCQNKFSDKARHMMRIAQEAGSTGGKGRKKVAKDFKQCYEDAKHISDDGWCGMPATAFRNACVAACRMTGVKMTHAKLSIFVEADGIDAGDMSPLIKITKGKPKYSEMAVRNETGVCDLRARPMWAPGWEAIVRIRFDGDQFTLEDVTNLLNRVGMQVGIGEGRPSSPKSCGMGWGLFEIATK